MMTAKCGACGATHKTIGDYRACAEATPAAPISEIGARMVRSAGIPLSEIEESRERWRNAPAESEEARRTAPTEPIRKATIAAPERTDRSAGGYGSRPAYVPPAASEKSRDWCRKLSEMKRIPDHFQWRVDELIARLDSATQREVSQMIDALKDLPAKPRETAPARTERKAPETSVTEDGIYRHPETKEWIKVQRNKAQGDGSRLYAKRLVVEVEAERDADGKIVTPSEIRWEYVPGLIAEVKPEWKANREDAAQFGALYGRCQQCRRPLTLEESIERAMGRICWNKTA